MNAKTTPRYDVRKTDGGWLATVSHFFTADHYEIIGGPFVTRGEAVAAVREQEARIA